MAMSSLSALSRKSQEEMDADAWGERRNASSTNPTMYGRVMQDRYQRSAGHILPYPGQLEQEDAAISERYGDPMKGKSIRVVGPDDPLGNSGVPPPPTAPWSQGGATDDSAWRVGSPQSTTGSTMPAQSRGVARRPAQPPQDYRPALQPGAYDEIGAAAETGSGASVAIARKRQELALSALENAAARESIAGQDLDGSGRAMVDRGRQQQAELQDVEVHQPQMQINRNRLGALQRGAMREEAVKDYESQEPTREFEERQYDTRYVQPARERTDALRDKAMIDGDFRTQVAEINRTAKSEVERSRAIAQLADRYIQEGQSGTAGVVADPVTQPSQLQNTIIELKRQHPDLTPEQYLDLLEFDTPEEQAEAARLLGGQG